MASLPQADRGRSEETTPQRGLDRLADLRVRPVSLAHEHVLPVVEPLVPLLPDGVLNRGSTVAVAGPGATSLAFALAAGPAAAGSWVAVVGVPDPGWAAAAEAGIPFERLVVVDEPPSDRWATVVAALIGAFDVILLAPRHRVRFADARRLAARARERGAVLVHLPSGAAGNTVKREGLEADIRLTVDRQRWVGLGAGHGHLRAREVEVSASGRRRAARPRHAAFSLPVELTTDAAGSVAGSGSVVGSDRLGERSRDALVALELDHLDDHLDDTGHLGDGHLGDVHLGDVHLGHVDDIELAG